MLKNEHANNTSYDEKTIPSFLIKDPSSLMLSRIHAGYHLDQIKRNCELATLFKNAD